MVGLVGVIGRLRWCRMWCGFGLNDWLLGAMGLRGQSAVGSGQSWAELARPQLPQSGWLSLFPQAFQASTWSRITAVPGLFLANDAGSSSKTTAGDPKRLCGGGRRGTSCFAALPKASPAPKATNRLDRAPSPGGRHFTKANSST